MPKMTIFRSDVTLVAALLAGVSAGAAAQQAPAIQRPIQQAQQAAGQEQQQPDAARRVEITSPGGVSMPSQTPATHTVVQGETLWAIAQQYLGDPLLWPEIYRLNTNVVEDPHWIYPGEELRLTPEAAAPVDAAVPGDSTVVVQQSVSVTPTRDTALAAQQPAGPVTAAMTGPTIFTSQGGQFRRSNTYEVASQRAYRAVREGEYFSSGFLTENQPLSAGRILANAETQLRGTVRTRTTEHMNEVVVVEAPAGETLQRGDLLMSFRRGDEVGTYGQVVRPTGLLRVLGANGTLWTAMVVREYGQIADSQEVLKVLPFVNTSNQRAQPVVGGIEGRVLRGRDINNVTQMQDVFFFDKGANDGVHPGDIFQIYALRANSENSAYLEQDQGRAIIVSTRAGTSSAVIVELYRGDIGPRSLVRQIRRMPS